MKLFKNRSIHRKVIWSVLFGVILWLWACQTQSSKSRPTAEPPSVNVGKHAGITNALPFDQQKIYFEQYTGENGLSMNTVHAVLQDRLGYIWIATEDGLNRFDGHTFKIYRANSDDPESLSVSNIQSLFEDRDGYLWLGAYEGGLIRYDPFRDRFEQFSPDLKGTNLKSLVIYAIQQDQAGGLWFGSNGGLFRYDLQADRWEHYAFNPNNPTSLSSNKIHALLVDSANHLWIGTDNGLNLFDPQAQAFNHYQHDPANPNSLSVNEIYALYEDRSGHLWLGTNGGGLNRFDPQKVSFESWTSDPGDPASLSDNAVSAIVEDAAGLLWVGTRVGLNYFNPQTGAVTRFTTNPDDPHSLRDDWIQALHLDRTGGLWVGSSYGGVSYFHPLSAHFRHFLPAPAAVDPISENSVWSVYQEASGTLWLGTNGGGLKKCSLETSACQDYRHAEDDPASLSSDVIVAIAPDASGDLWLATWGGGLNRFNPKTEEFTHFRANEDAPQTISSDTVWLILQDSQGLYWIGTDAGLNSFDPQTEQFTQYLHDPANPQSLSNDQIVALCEDARGQLWVGTQDGLNILDRETGQFTRLYHDPNNPNSLSHNTVFSIYEDPQGQFWIGTYGGGLNRYDPASQTFQHYRVAEGLVNDSIYGILPDESGNLWISTNNGLSKFNPITEIFKNFSENDGLQASEFNFNAYFKNDSGEMFFGGVNGVTVFRPAEIFDNPYPPQIVLQSISQGGEPLKLTESFETVTDLTLRWPNNYFDFEFAALNYYQPEYNQHAYRLENFDKDWNQIGTRRFGRYTNLPGGSYTLRLIGSNNDGLWNDLGQSLTIRVIPPLWQNLWFLGGMALVLLVALVVGYRFRVRSLETQATELENQILERTREIDARRKQIEALYQADEDLYRHLELDQVLQALVDNAVEILRADKGSLLCWDASRNFLVIRASHNFLPSTVAETRIPRGAGVVGQVAATGESIAVEDAWHDPRVTLSITEAEGIGAFIQVPIKTGDDVFGVFSADYAQPRSFSQDERRLLMSLAQRAAIAIQNAQIYEQARQLAASEERNRLARELHDAVTQTLFSASLIAEALPALWERNPQKGRERLEKLRQMSRGALAEMRALLLELRPAALLETSLENLLRQLGEAIMGRESISVIIDTQGECKLPPDVHIALYRIAQEALNNVVKHARANHVRINLKYLCTDDEQFAGVELSIVDDGRGFKPQGIAPERLGLGIMRERAESIGARLEVESQPETGTQVVVIWKLEELP